MKLQIYTVYDAKAEAYLTPFFAATDAVAIRNFNAAANDEEHSFHRHAEDYSLFLIGGFDIETATLAPTAALKPLARAHEQINQPVQLTEVQKATA